MDENPDPTHDPNEIRTRAEFAQALTSLRRRAGLTVREVAKAVGLAYSTVGDYFAGSHLPPARAPEVLVGIVNACGVSDDAQVVAWAKALGRVRRAPGPRPRNAPIPYRGLSTFEPEHADWFFGREQLTAVLLARLATLRTGQGRTLAVVGPSGSGKSSLLRAGLMPALQRGRHPEPGPARWLPVLMTPGTRPLLSLAAAVADATGHHVDEALAILNTDARRRAFLTTAAQWLEAGAGTPHHEAVPGAPAMGAADTDASAGDPAVLVAVVDQFEEVFTACNDDLERRAFIDLLCMPRADTEPGNVLVVLGLRADFYAPALRHPLLVPVLQDVQIAVGPMIEAEVRQAILGPAAKARVDVEPGLVELLLRDLTPASDRPATTAHSPGALPLLSHALLATWERGTRGRLTISDYRASGGLHAAVATTAEATFDALTEHQQELARLLFLRLVRVSDDVADTRRRMPLGELLDLPTANRTDDLRSVLDSFIDRRLVTADVDHVEITHEALLTAWPRLQEWIDGDRAGLRVHRQLADAALIWQDSGHETTALYRGTRLAAARDWACDVSHRAALNHLERAFLEASAAEETAEMTAARRRTRRLRQLVAALAAMLLVTGVLTGYTAYQRQQASHERDLAISRQVAFTANQLRTKDVALAAQLSIAAYQIAPTVEARSSLLSAYAAPSSTRLTTASPYLQTVAVSPAGQAMAAGGTDAVIQLWQLRTGPPRRVARVTGHTGALYALAFDPGGTVLASAGADKTIRLWSMTRSAVPRLLGGPLAGPTNTVYSVAFSPDGLLLAAGSADKATYLWNVADPERPIPLGHAIRGPADAVQALAFSPDGRTLAVGAADNTVRLWDISTPTRPTPLGQPLTGPTNKVFSVAFSPDGHTLAAGSKDNTIWLWTVTDPRRPVAGAPLTGPTSWVNSIAFSPDGRSLAAASSDGYAWLWDVATKRSIRTMPHPAAVTAGTFVSSNALATAAGDGTVRLWSLDAPVMTGPAKTIFSVAFNPRDKTLVAASSDNTTTFYSIADPRAPTQFDTPITGPAHLARSSGAADISPDGQLIAVGTIDGTIQLWRTAVPRSKKPVALLTGPTALVEWVAFSPDGRSLVAGSDDHNAYLWDLTGPTPTGKALRGHSNYVLSVAFSPDGATLATGSADNTVRLWDVSNGADPKSLGRPLTGAANYVYSIAFTPDGRTLAAGSADNTVRLWNINDRSQPQQLGEPLTGPHNYVFSVAFSPDAHLLAAGAGDGTVWLWDMSRPDKPEVLATLPASADHIFTVAFDHDGGALASAGADKTIRLWSTNANLVAAQLCDTAGDRITAKEWETYVPALPYKPPCGAAQ